MTVLAADTNLEMKDPGGLLSFPVIASDIIYKGAICTFDATGYAEPGTDSTGLSFAGIAIEQADNSSGSSGDIEVRCYTEGVFLLTHSGLDQTDLGNLVYVADDQTVDDGGGDNFTAVGIMVEYVSATQCWVKLTPGLGAAAA